MVSHRHEERHAYSAMADLRKYIPKVALILVVFLALYAGSSLFGKQESQNNDVSNSDSPSYDVHSTSSKSASSTSKLVSYGGREISNVEDSQYYYRSLLSPKDQSAYDVLENGIRAFDKTIRLPNAYASKDVNVLIRYLLSDNPDILWFDGQIELHGSNDSFDTVIPSYLRDYSTSEGILYKYILFADGLPRSEDPLKQMSMIMDYVASNTSKERNGSADQTICSMVEGKSGVCAGYSKMVVLLARRCNIPAVYVLGSGDGVRHAWVAAKVSGKMLYYDPLWYDGEGIANHEWCGCPLSDFHGHEPDEPAKLPI